MMKLRDQGKLEACLPGNHDSAALFDPIGFNQLAEAAVRWTRRQIDHSGSRKGDRWDFLGSMQNPQDRFYHRDELLFVHGSPRNFLNEYVFEDDVDDRDKMSKLFSALDLPHFSSKYCFMGHTHVPGVFVDRISGGRYAYYPYEQIEGEFDGKYRLGSEKLLINVGSVGQPRDGNPASCYAILNYEPGGDDNYVEYCRVEYDISKTEESFAKNIFNKNVPEFEDLQVDPRFLKDRLREGK